MHYISFPILYLPYEIWILSKREELSLHLLGTFMVCLFFLVGLGSELRALHLQSNYSPIGIIPPIHFALIILKMGSQTICPT
jgi:hypothetical protein